MTPAATMTISTTLVIWKEGCLLPLALRMHGSYVWVLIYLYVSAPPQTAR